jgi:tRNA(adenine34) deaminase
MATISDEDISSGFERRDDLYFMTAALSQARDALSRGEIPVGAVVSKDGLIVGRGCNRRNESSMPFGHAEMFALSESGDSLKRWRFDDCTLYVTLEPCPMCAGAIVQTRVQRVVFGAYDPKAGAAGTLYDILRDPRMPHRCEVTGGVMEAESIELLRSFFKIRRNKTALDSPDRRRSQKL